MKISFCFSGTGNAIFFRDFFFNFLRDKGLNVEWLSPQGTIDKIGDLIVSVNFLPDIARLAGVIKKPYVAWLSSSWINPQLDSPDCVNDYVILLHFSRIDFRRTASLGYKHNFFLPRPIDVSAFQHITPQSVEYPVSFVGTCYGEVECKHWLDFKQEAEKVKEVSYVYEILEGFIKESIKDIVTPFDLLFESYLQKYEWFEKFISALSSLKSPQSRKRFVLDVLLSHEADRRMRLFLFEKLLPITSVHLWGSGWEVLQDKGAILHGMAPRQDIGSILSRTAIGLNVPRRFTDAIVFRTFEVPAAGCFQLALFNPDIADMFEDGKEIVLFRSVEELVDLTNYYLKHETERLRIAEAGRERLFKDHLMDQKFEQFKKILGSLGINL